MTSDDFRVQAGRWERTGGGWRHTPSTPDGKPADVAQGKLGCSLGGRGAERVRVGFTVCAATPQGMSLQLDDVRFFFGCRWQTPQGGALPRARTVKVRPAGRSLSGAFAGDAAEVAARMARETTCAEIGPEEMNRECFLSTGIGERVEAYDLTCRLTPGKGQRVEAEGDGEAVEFRVDGRVIFRHARERRRPWRSVVIETWCASEFGEMSVEAGEIVPSPALVRAREEVLLSTSMDGSDPTEQMSYPPEVFGQIMRGLKRMGFGRVYFIDYGSKVPEFATNAAMQARHRELHGKKPVYEHMAWPGEWLKRYADIAHEEGLQFYTKFKAFDLHLWSEDPLENFSDRSRVQYEHREKKMRHRPTPEGFAPSDAPVGTIRFVRDSAEASPVGVEELRVWVSEDNVRYRPYEGPIRRSDGVETRTFVKWWEETAEAPRRVRVLTLGGLDIRSKFFAVTLPPQRTEELFRNRLHRLAEVEAVDGRPLAFHYAIHPDCKPTPNMTSEDFPWHGEKLWKGGLRYGVFWGGVPSGTIPVVDPMDHLWALDNLNRVIGFGRGVVEFAGSAFCPAYPEVQEFWLSRIRTAYESGADGVDIRIRNHNKYMEWSRAGWNAPVVEEYRRRYGVDINRERVDHVLHQRLLGEYYTAFVRRARALADGYERSLQQHVSTSMDTSPEQMSMMNIGWDWRAWLDERLVDEITLKEVFPGTNFFDEVTELARARGIKTHFCPFMNTVLRREPDYEKVIGGHIESARRSGCDGYWLHELYCILDIDAAAGRVAFTHPKLGEALARARG